MLEKLQVRAERCWTLVASAHLALHVRAQHLDPTLRANLIMETARIKPSHLRRPGLRLGQRKEFVVGEQ